jgi:hypothetical protein
MKRPIAAFLFLIAGGLALADKKPVPTPEAFELVLRATGPATPASVPLEITVINRASGPRSFCTYYTPFEGFLNDIVEVLDDKGARIKFNGMLAKRAAPGPDDYAT